MAIKHLYRQLCRLSTLRAAWNRVEESDGCAGIDSVTIARFADKLDAELLLLSDQLAKGEYQPLPLLRFFIAKLNGGQRALSVPVVRDRVVQSAVLILIEPRLELEFETCSFAYRKGRSVQQALQQVERLHEAGYLWVVEADITSYFDNVDHQLLFARVAELVPDQKVMALIRRCVAARIYDGHQLTDLTKGLPQGSPLVDSLITGLLNKLIFTPADFYYDETEGQPRACYLTDQARRTFVAQFERRLEASVSHPRAGIRTTWRGCIDLQIGHFIQVLRGEAPAYLPLEIR